MLAAGSGAMLLYRIAPRTGSARLPLIRDELNAELTRARRDPGSPPEYITKLYALKLSSIEASVYDALPRAARSIRRHSEATGPLDEKT